MNHTVLLLRHGQSESNAGLPVEQPGSPPLTGLGREQARLAAQALPDNPDRIVVSSFVRSQQTATPIRERFPEAPLLEWPIQEFTYLDPEKYRGATADERKPPKERYWQLLDPDLRDGDGAESFNDLVARVIDCRERLSRFQGSTFVVGHGQHLRALLFLLLFPLNGILDPVGRMKRFRAWRLAFAWPNATWVQVEFRHGRFAAAGPLQSDHLHGRIST